MVWDGKKLAWVCPVARIARKFLVAEGTVNHCTWRSHNHSRCLGTPEAKQKFIELLAQHKDAHGIEIYSYSVMDSHPHVQCRSKFGQREFSRFWQIVNYRFARWHNRVHGARGQVVMERMSSGLIQDADHQLKVMRYGDLNPVRAGIVRSPKRWPWSSYRHYAFGERNTLITCAPAYAALGAHGAQRRKAYVQLFAREISSDIRVKRTDLVQWPFIGHTAWIATKITVMATAPPS